MESERQNGKLKGVVREERGATSLLELLEFPLDVTVELVELVPIIVHLRLQALLPLVEILCSA